MRGCTDEGGGEGLTLARPSNVSLNVPLKQRSPAFPLLLCRTWRRTAGGFEEEIACRTPLDESGVHPAVFYRCARIADRSADGSGASGVRVCKRDGGVRPPVGSVTEDGSAGTLTPSCEEEDTSKTSSYRRLQPRVRPELPVHQRHTPPARPRFCRLGVGRGATMREPQAC